MFPPATATKLRFRRPLHHATRGPPPPLSRVRISAPVLAPRFSRASRQIHPLSIHPRRMRGPFLFFPSPPTQREAERRQAWGRTFRTSPVRQRAKRARSPVGVPPRLSPRGLTSPKAQPRPCFLGRGLTHDPEGSCASKNPLAGVTHLRLSQSSEHLARRS